MPVETQTNQPEQPPQQHAAGTSRAADSEREREQAANAENGDDMDADEILIDNGQVQGTAYDRVYEMVEKFAATRVGQQVIERADRALRTVENTAKWSLPEDKGSETKLERPMSWIPFLYLIVTLRCARIALSIVAVLIGNSPVTPQDVVYFIQTRRRKLRSIRMQGSKTMQERQMAASSSQSNSMNSNSNIGGKLRTLFTSAICRPGMHREPMRRFCVPQETTDTATTSATNTVASTSDADTSARPTAKRPRDDEDCLEEDANLTVDQMLTKYANANSDDDSDFEPNAHDTTLDESVSSDTTSDAGSGDEAEVQNNAPVKKPEPQVQEEVESTSELGASNSTTNGTNASAEISSNNNHNPSVEVTDTSIPEEQPMPHKSSSMPKPIVEIKKEYSASEEPLTAEMSPRENGGDAWQPDVARNLKATEVQQHAVAAPAVMKRPRMTKMALSNATATAVHSIETMSEQLQTPNESRQFRKNRSVSCSSTPPTPSASTTSASLSSSSLSSCSSCVQSRFIAHSLYRARKRTRSSCTRSPYRSRTRSLTSTSSESIDCFQSLDDVNAMGSTGNVGDNLVELETTRLNASSNDAGSETINKQSAAAALPIRNAIAPEDTTRVNSYCSNSSIASSSSADDEFYSPVGSPQEMMMPQHTNTWTAAETPKAYDNQTVTEQRPYGQSQQLKNAHHQSQQQQQQHQHQNRYRNRNRR